ncbi:MAG: glycosyltransferase [Anaeroplasma sp.]
MRIGLFTDQYYPAISGVVTSIKMLYEGLEKMGHECFIFTSFDENKVDNKEELENKNIINFKARPYPFKAIKDYRYTFTHKRFVKIVKQYNLDIIHVHTEYNISKIAIKASKKLGIPIVHTLHTSWKEYIKYLFPKLDRLFHKQLLWLEKKWFTEPISKASTIEIVPTKKVLHDLAIYGMKGNVKVIPTGIELSRFDESNFSNERKESLKKELNLKDEFVFTFIGRTSKEKNIEELIKGFSKAFTNNENVKLLIVGGGPDLEELKELASTTQLNDKVIFTDLIPYDIVPIYYQISNIFVNASESETQGLTYIEALSSGIPVLVKKDECILDVVEDGYNGFYFNNSEELINKMKFIYENRNSLDEIKMNTKKSVKKYSKNQYSKNILAVYKEAISVYNK